MDVKMQKTEHFGEILVTKTSQKHRLTDIRGPAIDGIQNEAPRSPHVPEHLHRRIGSSCPLCAEVLGRTVPITAEFEFSSPVLTIAT